MNQKSLHYKNININYYESGKGNTIVFLHGFLENGKMWSDYSLQLSLKYRVISIDLLGHGDTGCLGYVHSMEDMADAVFAVISHLKIRKVTLIGHSMGGYTALAFAEHYPDAIRNLILINSTARADSEERVLNRNRAIELIKKDVKLFVSMAINNLFSESVRQIFPEAINHTRQEALKTSTQGIIAALEGMKIRIDREVILHFSPYPIKFIVGKKDTVIPYEETTEQLTETIVALSALEGGHMLHIEEKETVFNEIVSFLKIHHK